LSIRRSLPYKAGCDIVLMWKLSLKLQRIPSMEALSLQLSVMELPPEADTLTDLREMVKDAVQCHFRDAEQMPQLGSRSAANGTGRKNGVVIIWKTMPP
jgi:hypothetical protein